MCDIVCGILFPTIHNPQLSVIFYDHIEEKIIIKSFFLLIDTNINTLTYSNKKCKIVH